MKFCNLLLFTTHHGISQIRWLIIAESRVADPELEIDRIWIRPSKKISNPKKRMRIGPSSRKIRFWLNPRIRIRDKQSLLFLYQYLMTRIVKILLLYHNFGFIPTRRKIGSDRYLRIHNPDRMINNCFTLNEWINRWIQLWIKWLK